MRLGSTRGFVIGNLRKRAFIPGVDGQGIVLPTPATFTGYEYVNITGIVVNDFEIVETPNAVPKQLICKVRPGDISIAGGRTLTANDVDIFTDLELQFVITKANGDPVPDYFGLLHPITNDPFNIFSDSKEGNYHGILPVHEVDGYQVTLYARGKNGVNIRVGSRTKSLVTSENTYETYYADSVVGSVSYDGLSPFPVVGTATYTDSTKRVFGIGLFTDYDHTAAVANINPLYRYNYHYFTGANEVGFPAGRYRVASKISDDEIELETALGADYTGITFSTGPKAVPGILLNRNWYTSGEWPTASEISWLENTNIIGYKDGFRLTNTGTDVNVMGSGGGASAGVVADHSFFMANAVVDGEFKNRVVTRSLSSTKTGIIRNHFHNVQFIGSSSSTTVDISFVADKTKWERHVTFIDCDIDGLVNDRFEYTSAGNLTGTTSFVVQEAIPAEVPQTGFIWYLDNTGRIMSGSGGAIKNRIAYTSHDGVNTFTLGSAIPRDCKAGNYCISTGSVTHTWGMAFTLANTNWSLGVLFSTFKVDCLDDVKDHDIYPNGYLDNLHICYNRFDRGIGCSYAVNGNLKSQVANQRHDNITFCDNYMTQHRRFGFDLSITNANFGLEEAYGMLVRGNYSNVMHCLSYYNAAKNPRFAYNIHEDLAGLNNSSDLWAAFVRAGSEAISSEFTAVIDNNDIRGNKLLIYSQDESSLEVMDNINSFSFDGECILIDTSGITGGSLTGNNLYNPGQPSGHVAQVDGVGKTLVEFNALVDGVNISENPEGSAVTAPASPTGLSSTAGDGFINWDWEVSTTTGVNAATGQRFYRNTVNDFGTATQVGGDLSSSANSLDETGLSNGTTYYGWVTAFNSFGESLPSDVEAATPVGASIDQYAYDVNDETTTGAILPSFIREALPTAPYTTAIVDGASRPGGTTGKQWEFEAVANSTEHGVIFNEIGLQTGDVEILLVMKGDLDATNRFIILRPAPRMYESGGELQYFHAGPRPGSSQIQVRVKVSGGGVTLATEDLAVSNSDWNDHWHYVKTKMTSTGTITSKVWRFGTTEPATPQITYTDAENRLTNAYVGIAGVNQSKIYVAYASVGLNGDPALLPSWA
jgi:hypothetical protein